MRRAGWLLVAAFSLAGLAALGGLLLDSPKIALGAAAVVLVIGLTLYEPVTLPILAMPLLVIVQRVGGGSVDLTASDFALFAAFWAALFFSPRPFSRPMRSMLWLSALYQVSTLFTVLVNQFQANTIEFFHAWLLVGGALIVGWAVGRSGRARLGLTLFMLPCLGIAILELIAFAAHPSLGGEPVELTFPYNMSKNFIGCVLAFAAITAYARPWWVGWPRWFSWGSFWLCSLAILPTLSRQALVSVAVGVVILTLRGDPDRKRSKAILLAAIPAVYFVFLTVRDQLRSNNEHNSASTRLDYYAQGIDVWHMNEWVGQGLRYWTAGRTPYYTQPPNAEIEVLASAGVVGLVGFLILFGGCMIVAWRMNPRFGTLALCMLLLRFVQGQFDLFWISIQVSVPFAIVGICVGAQAYADVRAANRERTGHDMPRDGLRSVEEMALR